MVLDWHYERDITGRQVLTYVKIIEESTASYDVIKVWTPERVESYKVSKTNIKRSSKDYTSVNQYDSIVVPEYEKVLGMQEYINPLGYVPMFCYQLGYTQWKGVGSSEIHDIADAQRVIYNLCSEMEQNIRISSHPSLVKSADTDAAAGAGAVITLPEHMNGDLKPYLLQPTGATVDSILAAINHHIESINRMAHLSSVRATVQSTRSGIAIEAEFMLLNAKLADRANSLKDAEEKIWDLYFAWMGESMPEEFDVEYETSFSLRDTQRELDQFKTALELVADPVFKKHAQKTIAQITLGEDDAIQEVWNSIDSEGMAEDMSEEEYPTTSTEGCPPATQDIGINLANRQKAIDTANYGPLNPALPNQVFWMQKADMWNTDVATAKQSLCGNCSFFVETQAMLNCIESGLAAGGATGNEWDSVGGGQLGYCEAFDFKCKSTRTCDAWVAGGPVTD
jgi:hypothetical protein